MKKFIAFVLIAAMLLGLAACGAINETEVSILWSDLSYNEDGSISMVPNSLINAIERAMYIENINYTHYDGNNDQPTQFKQATDALNAGCAALVVELVEPAGAGLIMEAAKEKGVPVIFINANISANVPTYDKAFSILADNASIGKVQGEQIATALVKVKKEVYSLNTKLDRNADGKISYLALGDVADTVAAAKAFLAEKGLNVLEAVEGDISIIGTFTEESAPVELIITADDATAQDVLVALQAKGYNKDRLTTHFISLFTVGNVADYKALVLNGRPAGEHKDDNVQEYFKSQQYLVDLRNVEEEDLDAMIYTTTDIIGDGRISGTTVEDYDGIAIAVATVLRNLLKGNDVAQDINADYINGSIVKIPFTTN